MEIYTLTEALDYLAQQSIGDGESRVIPVVQADDHAIVVGYIIEQDFHTLQLDEVRWTYSGGIEPGPDSERTRLMDPAEFFDEADHIRHHFPESVEALENGKAVTFGYAVVSDADLRWVESAQYWVNDEGDEFWDDTAGWAMFSLIWEES